MLKTGHFACCDHFLKAVWRFENNLTQCIDCRLVWINSYQINGNGRGLHPEELLHLEWCVEELNALHLCVAQLASLEIFISHGLCRLCLRNKLVPIRRKVQKNNGFFDCFATAEHGHCSQYACEYYTICVVDQEALGNWKERRAASC